LAAILYISPPAGRRLGQANWYAKVLTDGLAACGGGTTGGGNNDPGKTVGTCSDHDLASGVFRSET
jgi:hypothetical protein